MITASLYIGKRLGSLARNEPNTNTGDAAVAAMDTVRTLVKLIFNLADRVSYDR